MQPGAHGAEHQRDAARERAGVVFPQAEFERVDRGFDGFGINAVAAELFKCRDDQCLDLVGVAFVDALEPDGEHRLPVIVSDAAPGKAFAKSRIGQGFPQRRRRGADERVFEDAERDGFGLIDDRIEQPIDRHHAGLAVRGFAIARRIGLGQMPGGGETLLQPHRRIDLDAVELAKIAFKNVQPLGRIVVAIEHDPGVGRMIVARVEILEIRVGEVRNLRRIAARVHPIGGVRVKRLLGDLAEDGGGRRIGPLHLVEHHTLVGERPLRRVELVMPAFLPEGVFRDQRKQHRIEIHINEVVKVLQVLARHRIGGLVRKCHGVEEGVERPLQQFDEGLLHRIFAAAAQDRMFEDMRHPGRILGRGLEGDAENLVLVVIAERQHFRPGPFVAVEARPRIDLRDGFVAQQFEGLVF